MLVKILKDIMKEIGYIKGFILPLMSLSKILRVIFDSKRMCKKWKLNPNEKLLNTKLCDLRNEFNITIIN